MFKITCPQTNEKKPIHFFTMSFAFIFFHKNLKNKKLTNYVPDRNELELHDTNSSFFNTAVFDNRYFRGNWLKKHTFRQMSPLLFVWSKHGESISPVNSGVIIEIVQHLNLQFQVIDESNYWTATDFKERIIWKKIQQSISDLYTPDQWFDQFKHVK